MREVYTYFLTMYKRGMFDGFSAYGTAFFNLTPELKSRFEILAPFSKIEIQKMGAVGDIYRVEVVG